MPKAIRMAAILLLVLAAILAMLAIGIGRKPASEGSAGVDTHTAAAVPKRVVVVAAKPLPAGEPIAAADLTTAELAVAPGQGFSAMGDVNGRIPAMAIPAGTMIGPTLLVQGIAAGILPGERAIAIPVDELVGVSNRITPGDYVDVFMSLQPTRNGVAVGNAGIVQQDSAQARLLLSRLRVLGYGLDDVDKQQAAHAAMPTEASAAPEPGSRAETIAARSEATAASNDPQLQARSAILAVPVEDAGSLLLAAQSGKLFLALRNPADTGLADASLFAPPLPVLRPRNGLDPSEYDAVDRPENRAYAGINLVALSGDAPARANAPAPPASAPRRARSAAPPGVEIIRGNTPSSRLSSP